MNQQQKRVIPWATSLVLIGAVSLFIPRPACAVDLQDEIDSAKAGKGISASGATASQDADSVSFDAPNEKAEARLYRMFQKYNSTTVEKEKWDSLIASRRTESYQIQTGDTLWELSEQLFGDGSYWPKLWAENRGITNPHEIVARKRLVFVAGNESDAPKFDMVDDQGPIAPIYAEDVKNISGQDQANGTVIDDPALVGGKPEIPPTTIVPSKLLKNLPPSFPSSQILSSSSYDSTGLDPGKRPALGRSPIKPLTYFLADKEVNALGIVDEIELQEKSAGYLQSIFVKLKQSGSIGQKINVFSVKEKIKHDKREKIGPVYEIGGVIELAELLDEKQNIYRAVVVESVNPIFRGSVVTDEPMPMAAYSASGSPANVEATVIGGEYANDREVFGAGSVIFLDKGLDAGLKNGDLISLRANRVLRRADTSVKNFAPAVALARVGHVGAAVATAIIVESQAALRVGDMTTTQMPQLARTPPLPAKKVVEVTPNGNIESNATSR